MVNRATLIGDVGSINIYEKVIRFSLATKEKPYKKDAKDITIWHNIVVFSEPLRELMNDLAVRANESFKLCVEGKISYGKYIDKKGEEKKTTDIVASSIVIVGSGQKAKIEPKQKDSAQPEAGDDIPF